jgi:RNA polymerase sigma-70 factor, ECF subfamily
MIPWSEVNDAGLVAQARAGSQDACRELVLRFERPVHSLIARMVRDRDVAQELAQDTFVKAFGALARYDASHKLSSWLFKIAHNTTIDHLRRRQPQTVSLSEPEEGEPGLAGRLSDESSPTPEAEVLRGDLGRALDRALGELRPEYREVMVLRFREGLAYEEIAAVTSLPLGTVKTHIHRARKEMAEAMRREGWAPEGEAP